MSGLVRLDHVGIVAETWAQASDVLERQMGLSLDRNITNPDDLDKIFFEPSRPTTTSSRSGRARPTWRC